MAEDWNSYFSRMRLGRWTDNGSICWIPFHGVHLFIAGQTGGGKSNDQRVILSEFSYGIEKGAIEVIGFDAQAGVELQPVEDAGYLKEFHCGDGAGVVTPEWKEGIPYEATFAEAFERHAAEGLERAKYMRKKGINEWKITTSDPGRIIVVDEAGQLFRENIDAKIKKRIIGSCDTITYQLRKCGYVFVACTQQPNLSAVPIRHGLTFGIAHVMNSLKEYQQVTKRDLLFPMLPPGVPGLCYITTGGRRVARTQYMPAVLPDLGKGRELVDGFMPS